MLTRYADEDFHSFLDERGMALADIDAITAVEAMTDWYHGTRARDAASLESGADVLTVRWGTHERAGVPFFEYEVSRRMTVRRASGGYVWQLTLTFRYEATELTAALGAAKHQCILPTRAPGFGRSVSQALQSAYAKVAPTVQKDVRFEMLAGPRSDPARLTAPVLAAAGSLN